MLLEPTESEIQAIVDTYAGDRHLYEQFVDAVRGFFEKTPAFKKGPLPLVHSIRSRLKDPDHLREKVARKWHDGNITPLNLRARITDLAGVRVLHLHTSQFPAIHAEIMKHIASQSWHLHEPPKAYSWDPDAKAIFSRSGISVVEKDSYTSVHYVVRPHLGSDITCEIQIRTLFEEIWGEIDHVLNYPTPSKSASCREQLKVLAKLSSAGTRLADAIFVTLQEQSGS